MFGDLVVTNLPSVLNLAVEEQQEGDETLLPRILVDRGAKERGPASHEYCLLPSRLPKEAPKQHGRWHKCIDGEVIEGAKPQGLEEIWSVQQAKHHITRQ